MTKSELIDAIAARGDLTKARAELVVNCLFDAMTEAASLTSSLAKRGSGEIRAPDSLFRCLRSACRSSKSARS